MTISKRRPDSGFTATEIMVVLLVIAILMGASMLGYQAFQSSGRVSATITEVQRLINVAKGYGQGNAAAGNGPYAGLTSYTAQGYGPTTSSLLPTNYTPNGVMNPYGGYGTVQTYTDSQRFVVTETGLPPDVCANQIAPGFNVHGTASCSGGILTVIMY